MDENKAAAAAEAAALKNHLDGELAKARKVNHDNRIEMAKDLTEATEKFQEALGAQAKAQQAATDALNEEVSAATVASANALAHSKAAFDSKILMLTDTVVANAKEAEESFSRITGVVEDYAEAAELDRTLIKEETKALEAELNHALDRAISIGEAKAKAVAQRIAEHLKDTKRYIQVELNDQVEAAADNVLKIVEGKRQVLADNYLSLKAYAVAAADDITDYVVKGKGRGLSPSATCCRPSASWVLCTLLSARVWAWVAMSSHPSSPATPSRSPAPWLLSTASSTSTPPSAARCASAGQWAWASTSCPSSRSP